uniref:Uncharacterized protein n=1 Tax=Anguilla anguilla TaxID=7936 RepID=A0A0E9QGL3_ANGAN
MQIPLGNVSVRGYSAAQEVSCWKVLGGFTHFRS